MFITKSWEKFMQTIQNQLSQFKEGDYTVKIISTICNMIPIEVSFYYYDHWEDGIKRLKPNLTQQDIEKAKLLADSENVQSVLKIFSIIDTTDQLIAGYASIKNALNLFGSKHQKRTFESDPQQALDAGVKALAIAYSVHKLYNGNIQEKVIKFKNTPAGVEMLIVFCLLEIALPFTDNLMEGSAKAISNLFKNQDQIQNKFYQLESGTLLEFHDSIHLLKETLPNYLDKVKNYAEPIANKIKTFLPTAFNVLDSATGVIATGVDFLPIWTFLGTRLIIESIAKQL